MKPSSPGPKEPLLFCLSDLFALFYRRRWMIVKAMVCMALLASSYVLQKAITYECRATFRDRESSRPSFGGGLSDLFSKGSVNSQTVSLMKSRHVTQQVVEELGLQAQIAEKGSGRGVMRLMWDNLRIRYAHLMKRKKPLFSDPKPVLSLQDVQYPGEIVRGIKLTMEDEQRFTLSDPKTRKKIGEGVIGQPFKTGKFSFTLIKEIPSEKLKGRIFGLALIPMHIISEGLGKSLKIEESEDDSRLLEIVLHYTDRKKGCQLVNKIMEHYERELKRDSDKHADVQLDYLEQRRTETLAHLEQVMRDHAAYCSEGLKGSGSMDSAKEMEFLARAQADGRGRLLAIELEMRRLKQLNESKDFALYDHYATGDAMVINGVLSQVRQLQQRQATLSAAVELDRLDHIPPEFAGIELPTAQQLYLEYQKRLEAIQAEAHMNEHVAAQLRSDGVELSSLSAALQDPIGRQFIARAAEAELLLHDEVNRTEREKERIRYNLGMQKSYLIDHLKQAAAVSRQQEELLRDKIAMLQSVNLTLIEEQIGIFNRQLEDFVTVRLDNLDQEANLIRTHLNELREQMASLPDRWVSEKLVQQEIDAGQRVVQEVTRLVESTNLTHNLEVIKSGPLDRAIPSLLPNCPRLFALTFIGAFVGAFFSVMVITLQALFRGVVCSKDNLDLLGIRCAGRLSEGFAGAAASGTLSDEDLEVLRALARHTDAVNSSGGRVVLCLNGETESFGPELGGLISRTGEKIVHVGLDFDQPGAGLMQVLEGSAELTIVKGEAFDRVESGGATRYRAELLATAQFAQVLAELKKTYDTVILSLPASVSAAESLAVAEKADVVVGRVTEVLVQDVERLWAGNERFIAVL